MLPVRHDGELRLVRWGARGRKGALPPTGFAWLRTLEAGGWSAWRPEPVLILGTFFRQGGVWTSIREGIRGLLVEDEAAGEAVVYMLCELASNYFRNMTRYTWMPCLIGEVI